MKKYYKIPMTERVVLVNGETLFSILSEVHPELYTREKGRIEIQYGLTQEPGIIEPGLQKLVDEYNEGTKELYRQLGVPTHIIAINDEEGNLFEYATKTPLEEFGHGSFVSCREVSQQEAYEYLDSQNHYYEETAKFFPQKDNAKSLIKKAINFVTGNNDK